MTITPPVVSPVSVDPINIIFRANQDIQPFSYRSTMTYGELLNSIRTWLYNTLVPYLNTNFEDFTESWLDNVTQIDTAVNTALSSQADAINSALTTQQQQVADELATTLNEITSGESAALNDSAIYNALQVANSQTLALLDARYDGRYAPKPTAFGFYLLQGTGIDLTGVADSTAAVQAFFSALTDGASVVVPANAIINLQGGINVTKRIHLSGGGELRWTAGIAGTAMLNVTVDGCNFDGLYLTNPNHLAAQTGTGKTAGIFVNANKVRISQCRIVGQQGAIWVTASGEYHDFTIIGNIVEDVPGSGDGAASSSSNGEDRGDGIYVMGATATIVGNRVSALAGTDARIGIGLEALSTYEGTAYVHGDSMCTIGHNIVTGQFRRGITDEGVTGCTIVGNTVADATWYGINLVNTAHYSVIAENTVQISRSASDNQGSAWTPIRAGIFVYDNVINGIIRGNNIIVTGTGGANVGIGVQVGANGVSTDLVIEGNTIDGGASNLLTNGIRVANGAKRVKIRGNTIKGWTGNGVILSGQIQNPSVFGNHIIGNGSGIGVNTGDSGQTDGAGTFDHNIIENVGTGLAIYFRSALLSASFNKIRTATTGIDMFGWVGPIVATVIGNMFVGVTGTHIGNAPSGTGNTYTALGNN